MRGDPESINGIRRCIDRIDGVEYAVLFARDDDGDAPPRMKIEMGLCGIGRGM